jgi:hypothetical protein
LSSAGDECADEIELWAKVIEGNLKAIARVIVSTGCVRLTRDYVVENGEVFISVAIHDGLHS